MSQFAAITKLLSLWRADGYDRSEVEIWGVGYAGSEPLVTFYSAGSEGACFADSADPTLSAWAAFGAAQDDLVIIDKLGVVRYHVNLHAMSLLVALNRDTLDLWVRGLLTHLP